MHYSWESCQGTQRAVNSDAGVLFQNQQVLVSALVDGAEDRQSKGAELANYWANKIVIECAAYITSCSADQWQDGTILELLIRQHQSLRHQFLHQRASYVLLIMNKVAGEVITFHCGDCLAGVKNDAGVTEWIIHPHNCAEQLEIMGVQDCQEFRHILTRCLNAKRFINPEINHHKVTAGKPIILASDGFCFHDNCDDASKLILCPGFGHNSIKSDCDNFISIRNR